MIDPQEYIDYLRSKEIFLFTENFNAPIEFSVLNDEVDWNEANKYYQSEGIVVVDNILKEEVCIRLREFKLTTNYRDAIYEHGGYEAIDYHQKRLWFPLLEKIVIDFNEKIPFLKNLPFQRAWSFIYENNCSGVEAHADPASVNCNLWVTPNESIINIPQHNGLNIWNVESPASWTHEKYNGDEIAIKAFLKEQNAHAMDVQYKFNRCVFFNSKFFHQTQPVRTKEGHANKRINYTFLFGNSDNVL